VTFSPRSLHVRIALYFIGLLAAVQLITHLVVHQANDRIASAHTQAELAQGERVLRRSIEERGTRLQQAVRVLVSDFAFRKTVTAGDPATMQSALDNHGVRLGANVGLVISDTGRIVASFGLPATASPETLSQLVKAIEQKEDQTWIALIGGKAFQFAVAPVLVPDPYGWVAFGFVLDDRVAADLKQLVDLEISFLAQDAAGHYIISASSLTPVQREILQQQVASQAFRPGAWPAMNLAEQPYATSGVKLDNESSVKAAALVQKSIEKSIAPFQKISVVLSIVALVGALAGIICSVWIAGAIAKPIQVLTEVTNRIRRGEKSVTVPTHFAGEIGELATGFDQMNQEIEKREAEILRLAFVDPLTQLANRAGLMKAAAEAQDDIHTTAQPNHGTVIAIALLDIARLQHINDGLGYSVGDRVIKAVALRLQKSARSNETVARTQGDGFAWLMHDTDAAAINRRLLTLIEEFAAHPIDIEDQTIDVQVHVGWALARSNQNDASEVFRRAEIALHAASVRQISPIRHELTMDIDSGSQLGLLSELRHAVARDEFVLYYQPKLTLDGKPAGVEALVRWNHPTRGFLAPGAFIEFAEKTGNIRAITRRLIEHAAKQSTRWEKMGLDISIAVNVSAHDLQDETFPLFVAQTLQDHGARADRLKLEITERALLENFAAAERALTQLGDAGIHTALDDYGTGYATLTHLSRLPVSELKIDRSFITDLTIDSRNFAIAITTVQLAHRLGMRAVAEGVETVEELNALQKTGCDEVQGYLFGKPMSADSLTEWWKTRNAAYSTIKRAKDFV
jgi:diguanylate cyclase (GGDEF)-like protein